jgi:N-acyl-phosphatidylethanolamine-hydrolysing phospholipase D
MDGWGEQQLTKTIRKEIEREHKPVLLANGRYTNPWKTWTADLTLWDGASWLRQWSPPSPPSEEEVAAITHQDVSIAATAEGGGLVATWLGHSTVLLQCDGLNVLTDPVWTEQLANVGNGFRRACPPCVSLESLPKIHACLVSHSHSDHFDEETVHAIEGRHRPVWCVPPSFAKKIFKRDRALRRALEEGRCVELGWWEKRALFDGGLEVVGLPAQHWSNRGLLDMNVTLWNSFALRFPACGKRVFFVGDTGYCPAFQCIGRAYGPFDLALLPIGAYAPRSMLERQHVDPEQAVLVHKDVRAGRSLGIHWGTWRLSNEPFFEPPKSIRRILKREGLPLDEFVTTKHGGALEIN